MKKIKPITIDKRRDVNEIISERDLTQLRALLGSLQWPAVQSSPHLQGSTSILSGQVSKATNQTLMDCNKLLKFSKDNSDVGLVYEHLGEVQDLRLLCFFDAAFATRTDGSSQLGYIILMINKSLLRPDGVEGAYHILDWRSQKTPRVARSSLGAEAQGGGQACDALEHVCVYWNCLLDPRRKLKELLDCKSTLEPTMVTDAKALYDSFHREGYSNSVVDKRVSLEVKVMKERLLALGGNLRWMSSERQLADGLTKESARGLLAERLRYGKLKLIWDPTYKAAKKKTKDELKASLQESTFSSPPLNEPHQALPTAGTELPENDSFPDGMPDDENHPEYVRMAITNATVSYVLEACEYALVSEESFVVMNTNTVVPSHGLRWPCSAYERYLRNLVVWTLVLLLLPGVAADTIAEAETPAGMDSFMMMLCTVCCLFFGTFFMLGRWSRAEVHVPVLPMFTNAATQTDETPVSRRLRAEIEEWQLRALEYQSAAIESKKATDLAIANMNYAGELMYRAAAILRRRLVEMDNHRIECPLHRGIYVAKHGRKLHIDPHCSSLEGRDQRNVDLFEPCALCSGRILPPDCVQISGGTSLRTAICTWLESRSLQDEGVTTVADSPASTSSPV